MKLNSKIGGLLKVEPPEAIIQSEKSTYYKGCEYDYE